MIGNEQDFHRSLALLWDRRRWIAAFTLFAASLGVLYGFLAKPVYHSQAIIALKDAGKGGDASRFLSQLGGMGGMVASQMGLGNTNLDKIEVILNSHELAEAVIERNNLMPVLFPDVWDSGDSAWIPENPKKIPTLRNGIARMKGGILTVSLDVKKNMIRVGANYEDPQLAWKFVEFYLAELNRKIRDDVIRDAEANRNYLEKQLSNTLDPILMEKIHSMIGFEIEKSMLVSSQAFEVLEKPVVPMKRLKPKRTFVVITAFFTGALLSIMGALALNAMADLKTAMVRVVPGSERK